MSAIRDMDISIFYDDREIPVIGGVIRRRTGYNTEEFTFETAENPLSIELGKKISLKIKEIEIENLVITEINTDFGVNSVVKTEVIAHRVCAVRIDK